MHIYVKGHMAKMAAMHLYGKNLQKSLVPERTCIYICSRKLEKHKNTGYLLITSTYCIFSCLDMLVTPVPSVC